MSRSYFNKNLKVNFLLKIVTILKIFRIFAYNNNKLNFNKLKIKMKTGTLITIGVIVLLGAWLVFWTIGVSNAEKKLYLRGKAVQQNSQVVFDNTWKIIAGEAGVLGKYKDDFKEVYIELMDVRYKNDAGAGQQTLMKWVTENHISLDASLYAKLMNTIESSRPDLEIKLVTSTKTDEAFRTGQENDGINPFEKKENC